MAVVVTDRDHKTHTFDGGAQTFDVTEHGHVRIYHTDGSLVAAVNPAAWQRVWATPITCK